MPRAAVLVAQAAWARLRDCVSTFVSITCYNYVHKFGFADLHNADDTRKDYFPDLTLRKMLLDLNEAAST